MAVRPFDWLKVDEVLCDDAPKLCHSCAEVDISSRLQSVSLDLREEFQSVQSHNSTEKCGEYDEGAVWVCVLLDAA